MPFYPQNSTGLNYATYPTGPSAGVAGSTTLTAAAGANTKGSYAEIVASTGFTANNAWVRVVNTVLTAGRLYNYDIATGAGGAESIIVPDLMCEATSGSSSVYGQQFAPLRLQIAASTRIAGRCQCSTGSETMTVRVGIVAAGGVNGLASMVNYGADTTNSGGTQLDPGVTANTKGSYVQLTASTSAILQCIMMQAMFGHTTIATASWLVDLATGAGGAEAVLIPDVLWGAAVNGATQGAFLNTGFEFLTYIAASTRLACRCSCSVNTATVRLVDVLLVGGVAPSESSGGGSYASFG